MNSINQVIYDKMPPRLQNYFISIYGYYLRNKRFGGNFKDIFQLVQESNHFTNENIFEYQTKKLRNILKLCVTNVPYYTKLFQTLSFKEKNIIDENPWEFYKKLPILRKKVVKDQHEKFINKSEKVFWTQNTSGSTGTPLTIHLNEMTYKLAMGLLLDFEHKFGVKYGDKRATFAGRMLQPINNKRPPFWRYNKAENQMLFSSYHLNSDTITYYGDAINRFNPVEIIGYPSAIYNFSKLIADQNIKLSIKPRVVITNSETLYDWQKETIESILKSRVVDYYGTAEYLVFAYKTNEGLYKVNPLLGILDLEVQSKSEEYIIGKVLATTLTNKAMPLIKYELGDTIKIPKTSVNENPGIMYISNIEGRNDDFIISPDGRKYGRLDHVFKGLKLVDEAQIIQNSPNHIVVKLKSNPNFKLKEEKILLKNIQSRVGKEIKIDFEYVDQVPRDANGKFRAVIRKF